ncbi:GMC oxidoreductase domain-containing protein [Trichoderma breve]|uniref:GMC oxidoreductase domain-containing protein n=1 Tax=Trichoderma breve TaxID=2034170 RepID=A0A9W9E6V0_9HYPO|nr:GMC oxidoreductase domain-containing protein [Trichoderma breve]KAJ4856821.1 GMC oxidoreductase domain-containing protein [Trichoderma breve]
MSSANLLDAYDYIIVGGGTAGLVVASRLSKDLHATVLVIEAGKDHRDDPLVSTPGLLALLCGNDSYDWKFISTPQSGLNNRALSLARGKGLGGSSAINFMHTVYPTAASIDAWLKLGNPGWSYQDLAPYYQKFGTRHAPTDEIRTITRIKRVDDSLSGYGPIQMSYGQGFGVTNSAWMDAHTSLGLKETNDPISGSITGAFQNAASIHPTTKTRSYAASAYYDSQIRQRSNLTVLTEAIVTVKAQREVILAAGTIQSPQILEVSGVGGSKLLDALGIDVILDIPGVGENSQDHAQVCQSYEVKDGIPSIDMFRDQELVGAAIAQYRINGDGPLGTNASKSKKILLDEFVADSSERNVILKELLVEAGAPALSYVTFPGQINTDIKDLTNFSNYTAPAKPENYFTILNALGHPFSRGTCHITSQNIDIPPTIDPGYFKHPVDLEILSRSVMFAEKLMATEPLSSAILAQPNGKRLPETIPSTLEKAKHIVEERVISNMHLCGTCPMMPREDGGVVNNRLLVYGTRNLRIVDASVFPLIPVGNIMTTVYAVAEKAADLIKEDQK